MWGNSWYYLLNEELAEENNINLSEETSKMYHSCFLLLGVSLVTMMKKLFLLSKKTLSIVIILLSIVLITVLYWNLVNNLMKRSHNETFSGRGPILHKVPVNTK